MNFPLLPLSEISEINPNYQRGIAAETSVSFLGMSDVSENGTTSSGEERTYSDVSRGYTPFKNGDILFAKITPCFQNGKIVQAKIDHDLGAGSTEFHVIRPLAGIDARYILHFLRQDRIRREGELRMTGSGGQRRVPTNYLSTLEVPLPSVAEQRRIAAVFDQVNALRAKRREAIALLDNLAQSIFLDMFGDPSVNASNFSVCELESLVADDDRINYGVVQPGQHVEEGIPLIRSGDLGRLGVDRSSLMRISSEIESSYSRSRIKGVEILIGCVGAIGQIAVVSSKDVGSNVARAVARVPITDNFDREYIAAYLRMDFAQQYFTKELRTVAQPTLNIKQIKSAPVLLPPSELRRKFTERTYMAARQRETHAAHLAALDKLFVSLQQRAFAGALWDHGGKTDTV